MAAIDKIYGTKEQKETLRKWCEENMPVALDYFYQDPDYEKYGHNESYPMTNFPVWIDAYLWRNCPLEFVRDRLRFQYGEETLNNFEESKIK